MARTSDKLRVGVAGVGHMGTRHLGALLRRADVAICAVADPSMAAQRRAIGMAAEGDRLEAPTTYADAEAMLAAERLDGLVIATPSDLHARHCLKALEAGVQALVEKPIATTVEDGRQVVCEAENSGTVLVVGHIERFNPAMEALEEHLRTLPVGRPTLIETWRHGKSPAHPREEGVALDLAIHDVDLMCHLLDEDPVVVESSRTGEAPIQKRLDAEIQFRSGATGRLSVGWDTGVLQRRMVVHCEDGWLEVDLLRQQLRYRVGQDQTSSVLSWPGEPLVREHDAFVEAICNGGPSPVGGRDGLRALSIVLALLASAVGGESVAVQPTSFA